MSDHQVLVDALRRESDPTEQVKLIKEIGRLRAAEALDVLMHLSQVGGLQSGPAIEAMGDVGDPRAVKTLVRSLSAQNLAWIAKDALVKIGPEAVPALIAALDDGNPDVRFGAVRTLAELHDPRAIAPLEQLVASEDDSTNRQLTRTTLKALLLSATAHADAAIRLEAVDGLARLGDSRTVEALRSLADHDPDEAVHRAAQETIQRLLATVDQDPFAEHDLPLASRATRLAINTLSRQLGRPIPLPNDPGATMNVFVALGAVARETGAATEQAQTCLYTLALDCLRLPDSSVRQQAVEALRALRDPGADALVAQVAAHDPDPAVRAAANG